MQISRSIVWSPTSIRVLAEKTPKLGLNPHDVVRTLSPRTAPLLVCFKGLNLGAFITGLAYVLALVTEDSQQICRVARRGKRKFHDYLPSLILV